MARARVPSSPSSRASSAERMQATYLYCVVRSVRKPSAARSPAGLPGGGKPSVLRAGQSLWLVVSQVPLDRYGPEPLEKSLRDLEWVAGVAVAHEAVVEHFARAQKTTVVPMKLFTMFSSVERAADEMARRREEIDAVMKRIAGCEEWGVRVMRSTQPAGPTPVSDATSGTAFLAARKQVRDRALAAAQQAASAAAVVFDELSPLARDARRRTDSPVNAVPPLLDAAFLVPVGKRARFRMAARRAARKCAASSASMTLTGPWPAYNFVHPAGESR